MNTSIKRHSTPSSSPLIVPISGLSASSSILNLTPDLLCPKCGVRASEGAFFNMNCLVDSLNLTAVKNQQTNSWMTKDIKYDNMKIVNVKCLSCLNHGDIIDFQNKEKSINVISKIYKIQNEYSVLKSKGKTFFVKTNIIPRGLEEGAMCEVHGILLAEIENNSTIESDGVFIT